VKNIILIVIICIIIFSTCAESKSIILNNGESHAEKILVFENEKAELIIEIESDNVIDFYFTDEHNFILYQQQKEFKIYENIINKKYIYQNICLGCFESGNYYAIIDNTEYNTKPVNTSNITYKFSILCSEKFEKLETKMIYLNYVWHYNNEIYQLNFSLPQSVYNAYRHIPVFERILNYNYLVTTKDETIKQIFTKLSSYKNSVAFFLAFVQHLKYILDNLTGYKEYPQFPVETLGNLGGDCEDTAILFATLAKLAGYKVVLIKFGDHMGVGIAMKGVSGTYFLHKGVKYYYCETTSTNWDIGKISPEYLLSEYTIIEVTDEQLSKYWQPKSNDIYKLVNYIFPIAIVILLVLIITELIKLRH